MRLKFLKPGLLAVMLSIQPIFWGCSSSSEEGEEVEATEENEAANVEENGANESDQAASEEGGDSLANSASGAEGAEGAPESMGGEATTGSAESDSDLQQIITELNQSGDAGAPANAPVNAAPAVANNATLPANPAPVVDAAAKPAAAPVPTAAVAAGTLPEMGSKMPYIIQTGDTLAVIAKKIYGKEERFSEIKSLSGLENANKIFPGEVVYYQLNEETRGFAEKYEGAPIKEVTVKKGDTLSTIAAQAYGNASHWKTIWRNNGHISNPDKLTVGQVVYYVDYSAVGMTAQVKTFNKTFKTSAHKVFKNFNHNQMI